MQVDFTPSEVAVLSGVLMAQCHPLLMALREKEINEKLMIIMTKLDRALVAEEN